ncbi:PREDICTED: interleukin-2 receptor subunit alpha-like, partial [Mesitornis unicolor]|uniref:interleukin-2 receptor subunit alpha-like n=1 Tax=Mesitornis unicolor TaxID=54374 RepID=UPI00052931DB
ECPPLPTIEFADVTAERYPLGTRLYYECVSGYKRRSGQYLGIRCQNTQQKTSGDYKGLASWDYKEFECVEEKILLSTAPLMELNSTQKLERNTQSPMSQKRENLSESNQKDFCGPPRTVPHASLSLNRRYYVGQVLYFKCQSGYDKRPPTSGTRSCKKVNGKIRWTSLRMRCANDSSYSDEWLPQTTEPGMMVALVSHQCHDLFLQGLDPPAQLITPA